jgi:hypothetical protein
MNRSLDSKYLTRMDTENKIEEIAIKHKISKRLKGNS